MTYQKEYFTFDCSKRVFFANDGIIGISEKPYYPGDEVKPMQGYDGSIQLYPNVEKMNTWNETYTTKLTKEEAIELADYMIGVWGKYKERQMGKEIKVPELI